MIQLGVNIDHIASVRQVRYRDMAPEFGEPDPVRAAHEAELGGADGITVHLREDRRHIQDRDVELLRRLVRIKFNLEMAATDEMVSIATQLKPDTAMLVPEGRQEVTTEGGLDIAGQQATLGPAIKQLKRAGIVVSVFIDAQSAQVDAAAALGCDVCEVHTGPYAAAFATSGGDLRRTDLARELERVRDAGQRISNAGMRFNAGHALNYANVGLIAGLDRIEELHIGHAIVSRAVFTGLRHAVGEMKMLMVQSAAHQPERGV